MNKTIFNVFIFAAGAAIGSAVTWKVVKTKYEQLAQEEIDSVKETFARLSKGQSDSDDSDDTETAEDEEDSDSESNNADLAKYADLLDHYRSADENEQRGGAGPLMKKPYVISPDMYGEEDGYETVTLTYYADGVLEDDYYNVVDDVECMVGLDFMNHFDEYEDDPDSVYVRDESAMMDYEILRDQRKYSDTKPMEQPHQVDY